MKKWWMVARRLQWEKVFGIAAHISQVALVLIAYYGYVHTVVPLYDKALLEQDIEQKTNQIRELDNKILTAEEELRYQNFNLALLVLRLEQSPFSYDPPSDREFIERQNAWKNRADDYADKVDADQLRDLKYVGERLIIDPMWLQLLDHYRTRLRSANQEIEQLEQRVYDSIEVDKRTEMAEVIARLKATRAETLNLRTEADARWRIELARVYETAYDREEARRAARNSKKRE